MKKLAWLSLLFSLSAHAFTEVDAQNIYARNMVKNPGFENGFAGWSVLNGSASTTTNVGAVGFGNAAVIFTPSGGSTSGVFKTNDFVLSAGLYGNSCVAKTFYRGSANGYGFSVLTDAGTLVAGSVLQDKTNYTKNAFTFQCPSSPSRLRLQVTAPKGLTSSVLLDNFYVGEDYSGDTFSSSKASWMGYHALACRFDNTGTSFSDPGTSGSCTLTEVSNNGMGNVTSSNIAVGVSGTRAPRIEFVPPRTGFYLVIANVMMINTSTSYSYAALNLDGTRVSTSNMSGQVQMGITLSGVLNATTLSQKVLKIETAASGNTARIGDDGTAAHGTAGMHAIDWTIIELR